jgi:Tfp pilus assembly ATPase PilU
MTGSLPDCCAENKITNRAELIDCLEALEDTNNLTIEALEGRLNHLTVMRNTDHLGMFREDEGLLDIYTRATITLETTIDALRKTHSHK